MEEAPHLHLYTAVVWHKTLKRRLRLVVLLNRKDPAKPRFIVLGSTDPELNGRKLVELYAARFQIEFLFRDSKQFTGLLDCQARAAAALDFHFNASLATLNLVHAEDWCMQQGQEPRVFSMASWKQCHFNERLLEHLLRSSRRNVSPVELIDGSFLMSHEYVAGAPVELMQIRQTASSADGVLHHPPEPFNGIEVVPTMGR
jgi:hypothetical protein